MSWLTDIFSGSVGGLVSSIGDIADKFHLSGEEKLKFQLEMEALIQQRDAVVEETLRSELQAKERILVAELTQGDTYTKRARPTVVYAGLAFILFNYCVVPAIGRIAGTSVAPFELPMEFWIGWSGIVATWSVGRSVEKSGRKNAVTRAITGSSGASLFQEEPTKG